MRINPPQPVEPNPQRFTPLKLIPTAAFARLRRAIEDPLLVVLLVWAFVFVVLLLISEFM